MSLDFTHSKYREFCDVLRRLGCSLLTVADYLDGYKTANRIIILRHDIDRNIAAALSLASLERDMGIRATYYVRFCRHTFKPDVVARIADMGHEIGYHYETLTKARGDLPTALSMFIDELKEMRQVVPVKTVSMHGNPLSRWNNLDLIEQVDLTEHGLLGDATHSIDWSKVVYLTDTGRNWDQDDNNVRDRVDSQCLSARLQTTDDLILFIKGGNEEQIMVSAHPNRWVTNQLSWLISAGSDRLINCAKRVVRGGDMYSSLHFLRSAYRNRIIADSSNDSLGFRLAQDVPAGNVFTQDATKDLTLETLGEENMLVYTPEGKTRHTITVFASIYSPYWLKLHRELNQYMAAGVKVRYLFSSVGEKSFDTTTVSVWCADNSQQALDNVQSNKSIEEKNCKHPLGLHKQLADKLGVKAVPTIILENGMKAEGYQSAKEIIKYLEKM